MRIFSGIQPTGRKHLGNYIGAILGYLDGQERGDPSIYCIVDLHATSVSYDPQALPGYVLDTTAMLMAAGLDPERCILFRQSDVAEHSELCWLLASVTPYGDLQRMNQFKDKSAREQQLVRTSLFLYPVLQAADILLYNADQVPVGDDQRQHVELAREVARRFNATYGEVFVEPEHVIPEVGARIMDLQDPESKMSTTYSSDSGLVYIDDEPEAIVKKIKRAQTDSGSDIVRAPDKLGITNLIDIYSVARGVSREQVESEFEGQGYGAFKQAVGEATAELLAPVRERYVDLRADEAALERTLQHGAERARELAVPTMGQVHAAMGVGPPSDRPRLVSPAMSIAALDLDLEVFNGPFDLLLTLVLKEEIDLLEVDLAEVVLAYVEYLERSGELDLEAATEFLVLIAALLELKSRLMLPADEEEGLDIEPMEAAEELLARMLEYHRYRQAAQHLRDRLEAEHGFRYRSAPLPPELRRISIEAAEAAYDPERLAEALGGLLTVPPPLDLRHVRRPAVSVEQRLRHLRDLLASRSRFSFDEAVEGVDRLTEAVTLFALLELYKAGEAKWEQEVPFGPITVVPS